MLRAVLLGLLSVTAISACKKESANAASQPGVAAGKVIEVKGSVTVKHDGVTRPLAVGETVEGDDTVMTGADGSVAIELAHNQVRWELGPGKVQKVNESIAWKAAKSTGPSNQVDQDTAAAGRPAERSAVDTTVSAEDKEPPAAQPATGGAPPPPPAVEAAPAPAPADDEKKMDDAPPKPARTRTHRTRAKAPVEEAKDSKEEETETAQEESAPMKRSATRAPMIIAKTVSPATGASDPKGAASGGGGDVITARVATLESPKAPPTGPSVSSLVAGKQSDLKACLGTHKQEVHLSLTVTNGKATVQFKSKVSAQLETCMKKVINSISFKADGTGSATIKP